MARVTKFDELTPEVLRTTELDGLLPCLLHKVATAMQVELTASEERVRVLSEALRKLEAEVSGLAAFEIEVREAIGNTNWNVLVLRRNEARQALGDKP